jgi:hypothetical protein
MIRFAELFRVLAAEGVNFIVVGGVAATAHGSGRGTQDLDIVYQRSPENIDRLVHALAGQQPYPRGAPPGLPFQWDARRLQFGLNFTLRTSLGLIDLLGEITGGGELPVARAGRDIYVYFDNDVKVRAPVDAMELAQLLGVKRVGVEVEITEGIEGEAREGWPKVGSR